MKPTRTRTDRQGICKSSGGAFLRATSIASRIRSSSMSSAFESGSLGGNGQSSPHNEHQSEMRVCMSLRKWQVRPLINRKNRCRGHTCDIAQLDAQTVCGYAAPQVLRRRPSQKVSIRPVYSEFGPSSPPRVPPDTLVHVYRTYIDASPTSADLVYQVQEVWYDL